MDTNWQLSQMKNYINDHYNIIFKLKNSINFIYISLYAMAHGTELIIFFPNNYDEKNVKSS